MAWTQLTIFDEQEKRVAIVRGFPWIFHTLTQDPRTLEEFMEAEIKLSGFSALQNDKDLKMYSNPRGREGTKRSPDSGGTTIVNLPERIVTMKAHLLYSIDDLSAQHQEQAIVVKRKIVDSGAGERFYHTYGLLSRLRDGVVWYQKEVVKQEVKPLAFFRGMDRIYESQPDVPMQDDPTLYWTNWRAEKVSETELNASLVKEWQSSYKLPDSWTIVDGILHKKY